MASVSQNLLTVVSKKTSLHPTEANSRVSRACVVVGICYLPQLPMSRARSSQSQLKITDVPVTDLHPASYNPRQWSESAKEKLKESIRKFGAIDPLIVNAAPKRYGIVIGGHFRLECMKELGFEIAPVVFVDIPDIKREKELNMRLNRNQGEWDFDKLKAFDVGMLLDVGFNENELSHIWDDALSVEEDEFDVEEELQKIKKPKTKPGDIYELGSHRLICGDATDVKTVERLTGKARMDMVYIDTPYNIALDYDKGIGQTKGYGGKTNDSKSPKEYGSFLRAVYANAIAVGKPDLHVFGWNDETNVGLMQTVFAELGLKNRRTCLWIKGAANVVPGVAFGKCYESCIYATRGSPYLSNAHQNLSEILNREVGSGNRAIDDILDILNIWLERRIPGNEYEHATQKPVTLAEKPLRRCTKAGDRVLDLTGGSGSTLISCEQLKRCCYMAEIEPVFCDLIIRRFEALTGTKASLHKS
jgi:DNA modification methylase